MKTGLKVFTKGLPPDRDDDAVRGIEPQSWRTTRTDGEDSVQVELSTLFVRACSPEPREVQQAYLRLAGSL